MKRYIKANFGNWEYGEEDYNGATYKWSAKVFEEDSEFGIDGGNISKLDIKRNGKIVCRYDRGWDIEPVDEDTQTILDFIVDSFA